MSLQIDQTLGTYRIRSPLGVGGMGEVWRAEDTNLGREVALKVLPEEVAADPERMVRFEREARLLAALNHPNVATLYGLEHLESQHVLVMELVEGRGLDELIADGPLPVDEAITVAVQLAEALEAAHEQGIVHRDLKPANIRIRPDGTVKVLDFGLAKAWRTDDEDDASLSMSPTMTRHATIEGVILGTAAYMSPEQARGHAVDKRADIWAFGVVFWEMLTGTKLFPGDTISDILAAVLRAEPDFETLPASTPANIRRVLRRCLQRKPKNRLHDMADARIELADENEEPPQTSEAPSAPHPNRLLLLLPWAVAAVAVAIAVATWVGSRTSLALPQQIVAQIPMPPETEFLVGSSLAISPDGSHLVFGARDTAGLESLWMRSLEDGTTRPLTGTEQGKYPFWSPDSASIGFFSEAELKTLNLATGVIEILAEAPGRPGGTWNRDGVIVAARRHAIIRVAASGGPEEVISTGGAGNVEYLHPFFLPDGQHFLYLARDYTSKSDKLELRVGSLDGAPHKTILGCNSNAQYAPSGDLVWWQDGHLRAQPFDLDRLELRDESRLLRAEVEFDTRVGLGLFSVAANGTLVYRGGDIVSGDELFLVDRSGRDLGAIGEPGNFYHPRLSPDGSLLAIDRSDETNRGDIWIYDIARGTGTRLTSAPEDESNPIWSPDGRRIALFSNHESAQGAVHLRSLRGDDETVLYRNPSGMASPWSWSRGDLIVVQVTQPGGSGNYDLGVVSAEDGVYTPTVSTRFHEPHGTLSPNGRFFAYVSDETGREEIYIETFPEPIDRWRVSSDGGFGPLWRRDGRELFFQNLQLQLIAVPVDLAGDGSSIEIGTSEVLFTADFKDGAGRQPYDTIDGRVFVINRTVANEDTRPTTLVVNALPPQKR